MSQENVELTQQAFDAFNRRDMGAFLALMAPDVEAESRLVAMEGGYHGHDGIRHWWQNLLGAFPEVKNELLNRKLVYDWLWVVGSWDRVAPAARAAREKAGVPELFANFQALAQGES